MIMDECYKMYDNIIKDFCNNILSKNDIKDPFDIFYLFIDLYRNNYFSKDIDNYNIFTRTAVFNPNNQEYNILGEKYSDYMYGNYYKINYQGMFMVNGDGVCRHINSMLRDIFNTIGYKAYLMIGDTCDPKTNKNIHIIDKNNNLVNEKHAICGVEYENKIIYLDAMYECIPLEFERNENNKITKILSNDYIINNLEIIFDKNNIINPPYFDKDINANMYHDKYINGTKNLNNLKEQCDNFRNNHLDEYEFISKSLHIAADYEKHSIFNLKLYKKTFEVLNLKKELKNKKH